MGRTLRLLLGAAFLLISRPSLAQPQAEPLYTPSIFSYGFDGFVLGAAIRPTSTAGMLTRRAPARNVA